MTIWYTLSLVLAAVYTLLMLTYYVGWRMLPVWKAPANWQPTTRVTVLIPARNESGNIASCLHAILQGSYPSWLTEIIVLDDFSTDGTDETVLAFTRKNMATATSIRVVRLMDVLPADAAARANKKQAIELGVAQATGDIIVTTDADCIAGKEWLSMIVSRLEWSNKKSHPVLVTGPVVFHRESNVLQYFQSLDFLGLMGITGAGIYLSFQRMGNGASLAYYRQVFRDVNGYEGNRNTASGDDMFLIQKVAAKYPRRVVFLKNAEAVVRTEAVAGWRSFIQQRLRWGTKNAGLPEWPVRLVLLAVFLFCWSIWINILAALISDKTRLLQIIAIQLLVKAVFDLLLLREMARFFRRTDLLRWFLPSFILHTFYIPFIGTASLYFKQYEWKGRRPK